MVQTRAQSRNNSNESNEFPGTNSQGHCADQTQTAQQPAMRVQQGMLDVAEPHEDFYGSEDQHDSAPEDYDDDEYQQNPESEDESEFEHQPRRQSYRQLKPRYGQSNVPIAPHDNTAVNFQGWGVTQGEEAWYDPSRWRVSRSKKKKNVFVLPIPTPGELKTLLARFTRPDSVRKGWGYSRNAGDAIEELWSTRYGWDCTTTRIEMDYGFLIRNLGQIRAHQQVNGKNCDRCFANGRSNPCDHDFLNACTPCVKSGVRCTYTDRRTMRTRELTGTANEGAGIPRPIPNYEMWFRSDQPPVPESPWILPVAVRDTKVRPEPAAWREEDAQYNAHEQQYGFDPHVNPVLYDNQGNNPKFIVNGVPHVNPAVHQYRARPSGRLRLTGPDGDEYRPGRRPRMRRLDLGTHPAQDDMHPGMQNEAPGGAYGGQNLYPQQQLGQMPQQGAGQGMGGGGQHFNHGAGGGDRGGRNPNPPTLTSEQAYINELHRDYWRLKYEVETIHAQNQYFLIAFERLEQILPKFVLRDNFPMLGPHPQRANPFRVAPPGTPLNVDTASAQQAAQYGRHNASQAAPPAMPRNPMNQPRGAGLARNPRPMPPPGSYPSSAQQASFPPDVKTPLHFGHPASAPPQQTSFAAPVHTPQQTSFLGSAHTPHQASFLAATQPAQPNQFQGPQQFTAPQSNLAGPSQGPSRPTSTGLDQNLLDAIADPDFHVSADFMQQFYADGNITPEHQSQQLHNARRTPSDTTNPLNLMTQQPQPQAQTQGPSQQRPRRSTIGEGAPSGLKRRYQSPDTTDQPSKPQIKRPRQDSTASSLGPGPIPQTQGPFQDLSAMNPGAGSVFALPPSRRNAAVPGSQQSTMGPTELDQFMAQSQNYTAAGWTPEQVDTMTQQMASGYETINANMSINVEHDQKQNHSESTEPETSNGSDPDANTDSGAEDIAQNQGDADSNVDAAGESDHDSLFHSNGSQSSDGSNSQNGASRQATGSSGSSESIVAFHYAGDPPIGGWAVGPLGGGDPGLESIPEEYGGCHSSKGGVKRKRIR
ncbi:hypothetical protein BDW69DRAFT_179892 [Aspergillus filifer]